MDYEKLYKEALLKARTARQNTESAVTIGIIEEIFPELRESEDERIRKEIISIVKSYRENCITEGNHRFDNCLAWLEKQPIISEKDKWLIDETLYFLDEFQQSDRCYSENEMQNSITCKNWLKSLKERMGG